MKNKSFIESNLFVFIVTLLFGWVTYNLKLISINKLLGDISFQYYPYLVLGQGLLLLTTYKFFKYMAEKSELFFYFISITCGLATILFTLFEKVVPFPPIYLFLYIFFISNLLIQAYEVCMRVFSTHRVSVLKNPKFSILILLSYESGTIIGSLLGLLDKFIPHLITILLQSTPFAILLILIFLIKKKDSATFNTNHLEKKSNTVKNVPFIKLGLFLFTAILITKNLQGFATIMAIKALKETSINSLSTIFSQITFIQTGLIIIFLGVNFYYKKKSTNWTFGFHILLIFQFITMIGLAIFVNPIFIIGLGIIRKILNHTIYGDAQNMFDASIPYALRLQVKNIFQKTSSIIGLLTLSLFSFLIINNHINSVYIWIFTASIALAGLFSIKKMLVIFNKFHLNQIINFQKNKTINIPEVVNSTYALANTSAQNANLTLLMVITQKPPQPLALAIFYALGEIKALKSLNVLKKQFYRQENEITKSEIFNSLYKNTFEKKKQYFKECIIDVIEKNKYPYIDQKLFKSIYLLCPDQVRNTFKEKTKSNFTTEILSYLFFISDEAIEDYHESLTDLFQVSDDSIIKILAAQLLFKISSEKTPYIAYITTKFRDKDHFFSDVLQVISNLHQIQFLPLVLKDLRTSSYTNLPLLYCALALNYEQAGMHIIKLLRNGDPFSLPSHINQFYYLNDKYRFQIYEAFFKFDPGFLESLIALLIEHKYDFSNDVDLIYKEANRQLINIAPYEYKFHEY